MIKEQDLLDAIAECQGERNPTSNTCIKLAAYYTILNNIDRESYSNASDGKARYDSGSDFCDAIKGLALDDVLPVMDELMDSVQLLMPKLYNAVIKRLREI